MEKPPAQNTPGIPSDSRPSAKPEDEAPDWRDQQGWRHPYALYIYGTAGLFLFLVLMAYFAISNDWIPTR